ncbi:MAG: AMP-binding protein [Hyphomonadaceae bacterium]|nr:AMP-binding protein [Hyphomonadaceae bacterium]
MQDMLHRPVSEADLLVHALRTFPERVAFYHDNGTLTYAEFEAKISQFAQALERLGVRSGEHLGVLCANRIETLFVTNAANMLGACLVPLHPRGSAGDHAYVIQDAQISTLVYDPKYFAARAKELRQAGSVRLISLGADQGAPNLIEEAGACAPTKLRAPDVEPHAMCRLSYSGGTTGAPKGIVGTYGMMLTKTMIQLTDWEWPADVRQLVCAPLSHAGGSTVLPTLMQGGSLIVLQAFEPEAVFRAIERHKITCVLLVPTMIYALLDHPDFVKYDLSSLEVVYYGASPMSPARLREGIQKLGRVFFQFYGQTEAPMTISVLRRADHDPSSLPRLASCGRPVPWIRVALLDDECAEVADGQAGEICVRGPLVTPGYWRKAEETKVAFGGGWLHTGDIAVRQPDGFLRIVDRKKDMIISGGFNVFAREVEDVLSEHVAVANCAVIGVPDSRWGEAVTAVVMLKPGAQASAEELIELVRERKGPVQAPKIVKFVDELPITGLGKPDKKALRAIYAK